MGWRVTYYGNSVTDVIKAWPVGLKGKYLRMIDLIEQHGAQLGPPHTANLGDGLFEVRIKANEGIARAFFCYMIKKEIIILHAMIKKTQKTPLRDLSIARARMKELIK